MALNSQQDQGTDACKHKNCMNCPIISDRKNHKINGKLVKQRQGSCLTYNIIYAIHCTICDKYYIGRSVRKLRERIGEHRRAYYKLLKDLNTILANDLHRDDDDFSPGLHLIDEHQLNHHQAFNECYRVFLIDVCSPKYLELRENRYIHEYKTLKPFGINTVSPFSMPLLHF